MSTFIKADLIASLNAAVTACEEQLEAWYAAREQFHVDHRAAWQDRRTPQIKALRDELTKALKRGGLITRVDLRKAVGESDIENMFYAPPARYEIDASVPEPPLGKPEHLRGAIAEYRGLLKLLNAITDETVSTSGLKAMGFRDLQQTFMAAGQLADANQ
ncbi:hypothetical protein SEA_FUNSIZED_56 [Mycobacterium phage Funsized]|nr:hypothetical protein SEA_FUNSIZED_56 [Mycobacterium phage Funsized]